MYYPAEAEVAYKRIALPVNENVFLGGIVRAVKRKVYQKPTQ